MALMRCRLAGHKASRNGRFRRASRELGTGFSRLLMIAL
jgi:hypothetical protein